MKGLLASEQWLAEYKARTHRHRLQIAGETSERVDRDNLARHVDTKGPHGILEISVFALCREHGLAQPVSEYLFHPVRKWRFDFAWPDYKVALECDGGIWKKGGGAHSRPAGIVRDIDKGNAAVLLGWRVIRAAPEDINVGVAMAAALIKD